MEEEIRKWAEKLRESDKPVLVEGIKDKSALEKLGIQKIFTLKKPLFNVVEDIAKDYSEIIILTDFDKKGKELYGKLKNGFEKQGVKVDYYFREFLQKNTTLSHIEGIASYLENLRVA